MPQVILGFESTGLSRPSGDAPPKSPARSISPEASASPLARIIDRVLAVDGFAQAEPGLWRRQHGNVWHVVGLRPSRYDTSTFAVYFGVWLPDCESNPKKAGHRGGPKSSSSIFAWELSPVAPLKNTYWWPLSPSSEDANALSMQLQHIALPFFDTVRTVRDFVDAMHQEGTEAGMHTAERAAASAAHVDASAAPAFDAPAARSRLLQALSFLMGEGFARDGDSFWRRRSGVIDVVMPEFLAAGRFVAVHVAVWHDQLEDRPVESVADVSLAASHQVSKGGLEDSPAAGSGLWMLGDPQSFTELKDVVESVGLPFFQKVSSVQDVLASVRPEYRDAMNRRYGTS